MTLFIRLLLLLYVLDILAVKSLTPDYYGILGIPKDATSEQIKKAYRKKGMRWHPDKNPQNAEEATEKFQEIGEAYEVLSDPKQRRRYDRGGVSGFDFKSSHDPFDIFQDVFADSFGDELFGGRFKHFDSFFDDSDVLNNMRGGASFTSQSSSTSFINGKKVTTISMNKHGKEIKEVYENNVLVQRLINGVMQNLDNKRDDNSATKRNQNQYVGRGGGGVYAYQASIDVHLTQWFWYALATILGIAFCCYRLCAAESQSEHEHDH